ncbi:IscS subfamily cysteine desulfurase [Gracilibacillus alcaliphilus]|uniref:IscS subfamily cysteine desulfurase n=1 Tax=Gracilibacillus alcaliphilus TaxID=1401441 RepID=UPI00195ADF80
MLYFDYAATCPLDKEAAQLYVQTAATCFGNTSSLHDIGSQAKQLLETCREEFALMLGAHKEGVYFTSGGSEGNFLAIQALLSSTLKEGRHIITSIAEHDSVQHTLEKLKQEGYEVTALPFNQKGHIDLKELEHAIRKETVLVAIQHGNSEIGTIQPIKEISKLCRKNDLLLHSDCVQTFGKVNLQELTQAVDSLSISGHKFYGPKGVGMVYIDPRLHWQPFYPNTSHERGFRPGTVNVPAIAAMTLSAQKITAKLKEQHHQLMQLRQHFLEAIGEIDEQTIVYPADLPAIIGMRLKGLEGQLVMLECNRYGYAISTGSACHIGQQTPANAMAALGVTGKAAKEFIRISLGIDSTEETVRQLGKVLVSLVSSQPNKGS